MSLVFNPAPPILAPTSDGRAFPVRRVLCLGRNYVDHAKEMGHEAKLDDLPFFTKWAEAVVPSGSTLAYPPETSEWHHEVELVAAIGVAGAAIPEEKALEHVWGYGTGVDMTRRDLQARSKKAGAPWDWAKNGAATAPLGPLAPAETVGHPTAGFIRLAVNGETRQDGDLKDMIWSAAKTIAYLSRFFPLEPGDLIFTGTPAGVGPLQRGDAVKAEIEGLAPLEFSVAG